MFPSSSCCLLDVVVFIVEWLHISVSSEGDPSLLNNLVLTIFGCGKFDIEIIRWLRLTETYLEVTHHTKHTKWKKRKEWISIIRQREWERAGIRLKQSPDRTTNNSTQTSIIHTQIATVPSSSLSYYTDSFITSVSRRLDGLLIAADKGVKGIGFDSVDWMDWIGLERISARRGEFDYVNLMLNRCMSRNSTTGEYDIGFVWM